MCSEIRPNAKPVNVMAPVVAGGRRSEGLPGGLLQIHDDQVTEAGLKYYHKELSHIPDDTVIEVCRLERLQHVVIDCKVFDLVMCFRHDCCRQCNDRHLPDPLIG